MTVVSQEISRDASISSSSSRSSSSRSSSSRRSSSSSDANALGSTKVEVVVVVVDLIIMDFAKAFDKVPHRMEYYGIRGSTHKWINSWLSGRTQQVVLDGQASDPVPVLSGVPQGSVLGPVLFLIFINDLLDNIRSSVRLFADDCVLYRNMHSLQDCLTLQEDLTS